MPSYVALQDGELIFGDAAVNAGISAHSVKLALRDNEPIDELDGMRPDRAAFELIRAALARALEQLKREGRMPPQAERLTVVSNVGCTPAFTLDQRVRLRDICREAGLTVKMVNLVEEPVAAAFEVSQSGAVREGRTMVIDIGGGTLDVSVLEVRDAATRFILHASGGQELGGDKFTDVIRDRLRLELATRRGVAVDALELSRPDTTAIWNRAEAAKIALSTESAVRVALPGPDGREVEITREWYEAATHRLVELIVAFVTDVYKRSRLTLDRQIGPNDQRPGTDAFVGDGGLISKHVHQLDLKGDGNEHLDVVYLVGGAASMPALRRRLDGIFGVRLIDVMAYGLDPAHAIVMGLGQHLELDHIELRNPNWGVDVILADGHGRRTVYEPYAALMSLGRRPTAFYSVTTRVPPEARGAPLSLEFRPVIHAKGDRWDGELVPDDAETIDVTISLFGDVSVWAGGRRLYGDRRSPFADTERATDWLPGPWRERWREIVPEYDWRYDSY